ncbi:AAA family ATPase [Lactococcus lactis]|uniref:AAA family ATPase n=1 Tax=Lactococcus lactis TaxID=1358 RepID=UPI002054BFF7|nr:AAA family ATPase [Lactococcus lactis]BDH84660.1 hypothetical protein LLID5_19450 [Lactococcus lactis]
MITTLKTFSRKSFKDYLLPSTLNFKQKNLIFGYNGRGKSSLASVIAEQYGEDNEESSFRLFNRDYIRDNLIVEDNSTIKGVKAIFGKKEVDVENEIKLKKAELQDEEAPQKEIQKLIGNTKALIDKKHNDKKGKLNINSKSMKRGNKTYSLDDIIDFYKTDIEQAKKLESNEEKLKTQKGDDSLSREKSRIENLSTPNFSLEVVDSENLTSLGNIFQESYENIDIPARTVISWMENGVEIHHKEKDSDRCLFCGHEFTLTEVEKHIEEYNANKKLQDEKILDTFREKLEDCKTRIEEFSELKDNYCLELDVEVVNSIDEKINLQKNELVKFISQIDRKIADMSLVDTFDKKNFEEVINEINSQQAKISELRQTTLDKLQNQINNQETLVKGAIGLDIIEDNIITKKISTIKEEQEKLVAIEQANKKIQEQIRGLESQDSDYEDFREFLNGVLKDVEIDLKLILCEDKKNYVLEHAKEQDCQLTLEDISEGEKNLLALLFFYFELYSDNKQETLKPEIQLIIIDDPISSLDDANRFYVLELMKKVYETTAQVFLLTHSWNDYCELSYKYRGSDDETLETRFLEVYKDNASRSQIREISKSEKPYKKLFQEIYAFSQRENSPDEADCYHIPNSMRRVFEEFLSFKFNGSIIPTIAQLSKVELIITQSTNGRKVRNEDRMYDNNYLNSRKKAKLNEFLTVINVLSHKSDNNPQSIHKSAKFMMTLIEDMDSAHFNAMKG